MEDYSKIFQSHIIRFYHEWGYSRQQFAEIIGISYGRTYSLLSEGGDTGLTLNTMQAISDSLGLPLPLLLKPLESEEWQSVLALWKWNPPYHSYIPDGYTLVRNVVLPEHKAVIVNEWGKMTANELKKLKKQKNSPEPKEENDTPNE